MANELIGKVITAIYLADDKKAIRFDVEGGESIVAKTDGDCCSSSWIENVEGPEALIGSPVLAAEAIDMPQRERDEDAYEVITYYGFKIETAKGSCVLDYRNESNGYYGGSLSWPSDGYFYGGVYDQNVSSEHWVLLAGSAPAVEAH